MELLTIDELAGRLKIKKSWLYDKTRRKGTDSIPKIKIGKYLRFDFDKVLEWLENQTENDD